MNADANHPWYEANQSQLAAALAEVRMPLERRLGHAEAAAGETPARPADWTLPDPPALETLCAALAMTRFATYSGCA